MYFDLSQQLYNHVTQDIKIQELYRGDDLKTWKCFDCFYDE